uniref:DNA-directed RNA polymerase III subunit n=1 Tax=Mola mola TaxID=94237 RepID=A0A3Q3VVV9_MOLML
MAGKGRGVAAFTFNIEALGIGRGSMPEARVGPSPLFPITDFKPVPLKVGEDEDYMLALKQEMRGTMQRLPHNIKPRSKKAAVFHLFVLLSTEVSEQMLHTSNLKLLSIFQDLEKKNDKNPDKSDDETEKKAGNEDEEEEIEEEEYEEDIEEENDYIDSYFDNGEDFAAESDDNMDGEATY